ALEQRVFGAVGRELSDAAGTAVRGEDTVLAVVVGARRVDAPVVGAEDERALAAEAVDGDSLDADALDALQRIGEAVGPAGAALGEGDPLVLTAGVLDDHGLRLLGPTDQLHVVLRHDDGALVAGVGRAG